MPLTKQQKEEVLKDLNEKIAKQKAMVFVSIGGLKNDELFQLRNNLKENDDLLLVAKKTLIRKIFQENNIDYQDEKMLGQLALIFGFKDELSPIKISHKFSKTNENLKILGGFFENKVISREDVLNLASLPSKKELLAKLVGSLKSPMAGLTSVLQGNIKGLVYVLSQKAKA